MKFLEFKRKYEFKKKNDKKKENEKYFFDGYLRQNGEAGTRNYIGIISTVNCSATVVNKIAKNINDYLKDKPFKNIDGAVALKHSSGCGSNSSGYGM